MCPNLGLIAKRELINCFSRRPHTPVALGTSPSQQRLKECGVIERHSPVSRDYPFKAELPHCMVVPDESQEDTARRLTAQLSRRRHLRQHPAYRLTPSYSSLSRRAKHSSDLMEYPILTDILAPRLTVSRSEGNLRMVPGRGSTWRMHPQVWT